MPEVGFLAANGYNKNIMEKWLSLSDIKPPVDIEAQ
jgi:hypothetical protein